MTTTTTTTTIKVTNKDFYKAFMALVKGEKTNLSPEQVTEWCEKKIAQLDKKSATGSTKPTKTQVENEGYKERILEILTANGGYMTISAIKAEDETFGEWQTTQKMSALLNQLVKAGKLVKKLEKRVVYFKIATDEDIEIASDEDIVAE